MFISQMNSDPLEPDLGEMWAERLARKKDN